ncbi:MAG: class I SAM-dependent methyltransferase [Actinobacteria bacterium]|nr:class I SAM-dependent methyltransferase [Actinomycetota bacterium]
MGIQTKIKTAARVLDTFGLFELVRLAVRKLNTSQKDHLEVSMPRGVEIKVAADLTDEFYSSMFKVSRDELGKARSQYLAYQKRFSERVASPRTSFFNPIFDLGLGMSEFVFLCILIKKPLTVIETGVAAGVSTNAALTALQINGAGRLLSLDITPKVGELVDDKLKNRWKLEILPELARENSFSKYLKENREATIFLHDSDHSGAWQIKEFGNVIRHLPGIELILFDDISQDLIDFISSNHKDYRITVIDENRKYSAIILKV